MRTFLYGSLLALAAGATGAQAATSPQIGTAAVTKNSVTGALGATQRTLKRGDGVFQNESIKTGKDAGAQLLFRDETALTIGPDSHVLLDKLVYDPDKKTGEMSIRAVSGAFRFVTGSGPKAGYKIETPVGTIGVRGTIVQFIIKDRWLWVSLTEGAVVVCITPTSCVTLDKPGSYAVTNGRQTSAPQSKSDEACGSSGTGSFSTGGGRNYCTVFDDSGQTLYLYFLGIGQVLNALTPAAGPGPTPPNQPPPGNGPPPPGNGPPSPPPGNGPPNPPPGNGPPPTPPGSGPPPPPPPPPAPAGFSPIINPGVGVPPGLATGPLPPGLQDRCTTSGCTAPGPHTNSPGPPATPPGQLNTPTGGPPSTPPGQLNTPPGQLNTPPGQAKKP